MSLPPVKGAATKPSTDAKSHQLSPSALKSLAKRLCDDDLKYREKKKEELFNKLYKTVPPQIIPASSLATSVERQYDAELKRRKKKAIELNSKFYAEAPAKTLTVDEIAEQVRRTYVDAIERKKKKMEALEAKYDFKSKSEKEAAGKKQTLTRAEQDALGDRLKVPKKRVLDDDEINKILGL